MFHLLFCPNVNYHFNLKWTVGYVRWCKNANITFVIHLDINTSGKNTSWKHKKCMWFHDWFFIAIFRFLRNSHGNGHAASECSSKHLSWELPKTHSDDLKLKKKSQSTYCNSGMIDNSHPCLCPRCCQTTWRPCSMWFLRVKPVSSICSRSPDLLPSSTVPRTPSTCPLCKYKRWITQP